MVAWAVGHFNLVRSSARAHGGLALGSGTRAAHLKNAPHTQPQKISILITTAAWQMAHILRKGALFEFMHRCSLG